MAEQWAILDLPIPLEPIIVDLLRPLKDQLPPGLYLDSARQFCLDYNIGLTEDRFHPSLIRPWD